jgi:hypothetical protein
MMTKNDDGTKKYSACSAADFLLDEYFIRSRIMPTKASEAFWEAMLRDGTVDRDDYRIACYLFESLQVAGETVPAEEADALWNDILRENKRPPAAGRSRTARRILRWFLSGIASLLLCLFFYHTRPEKPAAAVALSVEDVKAPETPAGDIHLILSEHETVALEGQEAEIVYDRDGVAIHDKKANRKKKPVDTAGPAACNQLIVPKGKRSTLTFEDGSKVWVNAGTRVVYPAFFAGEKREIYLEGEAYFEISPEEGRPFTVKTGEFDLNVLGTSFNIMAYENDPVRHVVLVSGKAAVHARNRREAVLSPDEMYLSVNGTAHVEKVNVSDYISWTRGMYRYKSERLDRIMQRLSRYYGVDIVCEPEAARLEFSGKLDLKDDLNAVLSGISRTSPVDYHPDSNRYVITDKKE